MAARILGSSCWPPLWAMVRCTTARWLLCCSACLEFWWRVFCMEVSLCCLASAHHPSASRSCTCAVLLHIILCHCCSSSMLDWRAFRATMHGRTTAGALAGLAGSCVTRSLSRVGGMWPDRVWVRGRQRTDAAVLEEIDAAPHVEIRGGHQALQQLPRPRLVHLSQSSRTVAGVGIRLQPHNVKLKDRRGHAEGRKRWDRILLRGVAVGHGDDECRAGPAQMPLGANICGLPWRRCNSCYVFEAQAQPQMRTQTGPISPSLTAAHSNRYHESCCKIFADIHTTLAANCLRAPAVRCSLD